MAKIPESLINEIRNKADIVEVISRYVTLTRRGKNYWGLSPFRDDRNPSLSVSPDKQIYMDFATHEGGNVFNFIQRIENLSYPEAIIRVAGFVRVDMSFYDSMNDYKVSDEKKRYYSLMQELSQYAEYQLYTQAGKQALDILEKRAYSHDLLKEFNVGVILDNNQIARYLQAKGFETKDALTLDVLRLQGEEIRDVFYNRILFPIHDSHGNVIAFSARALAKDNPVKYINTSETPLYNKGSVVYNYHSAKDEARKEDLMILCEGVTDVMAFRKASYKNAVSLLGVFCTDEQMRILKQVSSNFLLAFDGDSAGQEATYNVGKKLINAHCKVAVWYNKTGMDPDELVRQKGIDTLKEGIKQRLSWYDFLLDYAISLYGLASFEHRKKVAEFYLKHFDMADALEKDHYIKLLSERTGFNEATLLKEAGVQKTTVVPPKAKQKRQSAFILPEKRLLCQMLSSKEAAYIYRDHLGYLISDAATELALLILDAYRQEDTLRLADLFSLAMSDNCRLLLNELIELNEWVQYSVEDVNENIALIKEQLVEMGVATMRHQIENKQSLEDQTALLEKTLDTLKTLHRK